MTNLVVLAIAQCGGIASRADLLRVVSRRQLRAALRDGTVLQIGRGRYCLPGLDRSLQAASSLSGVVSHRSAALLHGWSIRSVPPQPTVIVARSRDIAPHRRRGSTVLWRDLTPGEVIDGVTAPLRTVIDCARDLPFEEALAVADSALRAGAVTERELLDAIGTLPRTGRARAELVLREANKDAANPFESALRALSIEAVGPSLVPQVRISIADEWVRPDLVDESLRIVIEADSHEFHTTRAKLDRDCWRYAELVLEGWLVLRFTWTQVMFAQDWVRDVIRRAVEQQRVHHSA